MGGFIATFGRDDFKDKRTGLTPEEFLDLPWNELYKCASVVFEAIVFQANHEQFSVPVVSFQILGNGAIEKNLGLGSMTQNDFNNAFTISLFAMYAIFLVYFLNQFLRKVCNRFNREWEQNVMQTELDEGDQNSKKKDE